MASQAPTTEQAAPQTQAAAPAPQQGNQQQQVGRSPFTPASLYVGDLHPEVVEAELLEHFSKTGPVLSVKICRDNITRRSLGYGYVNFQDPKHAETALNTLNYSEIHGKQCRLMWSRRDPAVRKSGKGNVFIKNLDESIENNDLHDMFANFGNILSLKIATDENGKSKGYAYVHFETEEAAQKAIQKINGMAMNDKIVYVGPFQARRERLARGVGTSFTNVFVKNLPEDATEEKVRALFEAFGEITSCVVMTCARKDLPNRVRLSRAYDKARAKLVEEGVDMSPFEKKDEDAEESKDDAELEALKEKRAELKSRIEALAKEIAESEDGDAQVSKGFGFVNFKNADEAAKAVEELNGSKKLGDRPIYAGRAEKKSERQARLRLKFEKEKEERLNRYQGVNLFVKNLAENIDDARLRKEFEKFGTITSAKVMYDDKDQSKGFGFVCFSTPEEATKAVTEMNGYMLDEKPIYVALAQRREVRRQQLELQHAQRARFNMGQMPPAPMYASAQPMYFANGPGGQRQFMFQQPMMQQRGGYRMQGQQMPQNQMRGPYGQMPYMGMPQQMQGGQMMNQQQGQNGGGRQNRQARRQQQGGKKNSGRVPQPQNVQPQPNGNQRMYAQAARAGAQVGAQAAATNGNQQAPIDPQALAAAKPEEQKNMLGSRLYPLIGAQAPMNLTGKITGMLLEMEPAEVLHLIESPEALKAKVSEAMNVLQQHTMQQAAAPAAKQE